MEAYEEDFINGDDAQRKATVKRLTRDTELEIFRQTVNSPDWCVDVSSW